MSYTDSITLYDLRHGAHAAHVRRFAEQTTVRRYSAGKRNTVYKYEIIGTGERFSSQRELAAYVGVAQSTVSEYFTAKGGRQKHYRGPAIRKIGRPPTARLLRECRGAMGVGA